MVYILIKLMPRRLLFLVSGYKEHNFNLDVLQENHIEN